MTFEIVNPSDKAFMDAVDLKTAAIACILLSNGQYALREVDGNAHVPLFMLGGAEEWFEEHFDQDLKTAYASCENESLYEAPMSVRLAGEQSSLNDIVSKAHKLAERFNIDIPC